MAKEKPFASYIPCNDKCLMLLEVDCLRHMVLLSENLSICILGSPWFQCVSGLRELNKNGILDLSVIFNYRDNGL